MHTTEHILFMQFVAIVSTLSIDKPCAKHVHLVFLFENEESAVAKMHTIAYQYLSLQLGDKFMGSVNIDMANPDLSASKMDFVNQPVGSFSLIRDGMRPVFRVRLNEEIAAGWFRASSSKIADVGTFELLHVENLDILGRLINAENEVRIFSELNDTLCNDHVRVCDQNTSLATVVEDLQRENDSLRAEIDKNRKYMLEQEGNLANLRRLNLDRGRKEDAMIIHDPPMTIADPATLPTPPPVPAALVFATPVELLASCAAEIANFPQNKLLTREERSQKMAERRAKLELRKQKRIYENNETVQWIGLRRPEKVDE